MITCVIRYIVDQDKIAEFEIYAKMWLALMPRFGGTHHGYFLPSEGESDVAMSLFSFPSLADLRDLPAIERSKTPTSLLRSPMQRRPNASCATKSPSSGRC